MRRPRSSIKILFIHLLNKYLLPDTSIWWMNKILSKPNEKRHTCKLCRKNTRRKYDKSLTLFILDYGNGNIGDFFSSDFLLLIMSTITFSIKKIFLLWEISNVYKSRIILQTATDPSSCFTSNELTANLVSWHHHSYFSIPTLFQANPRDPTILFINILFVSWNDEQSVKITNTIT